MSENFMGREFPMSDRDFKTIQVVAYKITGINLSDHKKNMIYGRLARRLRALNIRSFDTYCELIISDDHPEIVNFVNAITTNLTSFFRENHHFEYLRDSVLPQIMAKKKLSRRLRIWSAGCSTGEEPYSIAMVIDSEKRLADWDVKILATDLDSNVVDKASQGVYGIERIEKIPQHYNRYFDIDKSKENVRVKMSARRLVTFKQLNLLHDWPMSGPFDIIFCRNVVIYFDAETQRRLFDRYANILTENGDLFIGHSENLHNVSQRFKSVGRTIYQRVI